MTCVLTASRKGDLPLSRCSRGSDTESALFGQPKGGVVGSSTYTQVWRAARALALTPDQVVWTLT